jgi:hypothetical protein
MTDGDQLNELLREVEGLGADLDVADEAAIQRYAEAVSRLLLARPDSATLRSLGIMASDPAYVIPREWTESDRAIADALEAGDVDTVRSELLKEGLPGSTVEEMIASLEAYLSRQDPNDPKKDRPPPSADG